MIQGLTWQQANQGLVLSGILEHHTLLPLWQQRDVLVKDLQWIDLSGLSRVDSAGLACLIHLHQAIQPLGCTSIFKGMNPQLLALIKLYNLEEIFL